MAYPVSLQFLATLISSNQKRISTAEVWNKNTPLAVLGTCTDGSVSWDVTAQIRRTCTATIESQGLEYDELVPTSAKSLLHPLSGNELRLYRGFDYGVPTTLVGGALNGQTVTQELCPLGVFQMTAPVVDDQGNSIVITITGNDRASLVSARQWTDVFPILAGTDLRLAIYNLMQGQIGDLDVTFKFVPTSGLTVPATTFGTDLAGSNDPMADAISLAIAGPYELFFDVDGDPVLQPAPNPSLSNSSFPLAYVHGENCTFTDMQRAYDTTLTKNGAVVIGVGSGGPPQKAEIWDTDPDSPLYIKGPLGKQPYIYSTTLVPSVGQSAGAAQAQLLQMAQAIYRQVHTLADIPTFSCVPNAAMSDSDILDLIDPRIGLDGPYAVGQGTIPLDTATEMTVTARAPVVTIPTQTS